MMDDSERLGDFRYSKTGRNSFKDKLRSAARQKFDHIKAFVRFLLYCLWPGFSGSKQENKVAYLDGLRGFAALLVYFSHNAGAAHNPSEGSAMARPFGTNGEHVFTSFPIVRLFFSGGSFAVAVFFVISGYVISLSPLKKLHAQQNMRLVTDLGVAFPKRFVRLYIPVLGTTFCYMTIWHVLGLQSSLPSQPEVLTYGQEILTWITNFLTQSFYFTEDGFRDDRYNSHLWTLPVEIRGSYTVYAMLLVSVAFHEWGTNARLWAEAGLIFYLLWLVDAWYLALFIVGMLLCDLDILSGNEQLPKFLSRLKLIAKRGFGWIYSVVFLLGLFLAGFPSGNLRRYEEYGEAYHILALLNPPASQVIRRFVLAWAASLIMICIPKIPWLKAFFDSRFCQYLGKISFCLYLIHGPILRTIGERVYAAVGRYHSNASDRIPEWIDKTPLPNYGPVGLEINVIVAQLIIIPVLFYLAGVATKLFDEPSVPISRWLCNPSRYSERHLYEPIRQENEPIDDSPGIQQRHGAFHLENEMTETSLVAQSHYEPVRSENALIENSLGIPLENSSEAQSRHSFSTRSH